MITNLLVYMYMYLLFDKQNRESTEGYSKSIVRKINDKFGKELVSTSKTYASPKRTGPDVQISKRPLSACPTRCKSSMETSTHFKITCLHESISLLRTRPDGNAIFPGVCAGFALVVQVLSWSKQRNFKFSWKNIILSAAHQQTVSIILYYNL